MSTPCSVPATDTGHARAQEQSGFFGNLPPQSVAELNQIKHSSVFPAGALLFIESQTPRGVYLIRSGRVKLTTTSRAGKTLILHIAQPGEILGMPSAVSGRPYELTAEALEPCRLEFVRREDFLRFLRSNPEACLHAALQLGQDCHHTYELIRALGLSHSVSEKLARLLLDWAAAGEEGKHGIRIKLALTHQEIAQLIGTSRETVTRVLGEFREKKLAWVQGSTLWIADRHGLQRMIGE